MKPNEKYRTNMLETSVDLCDKEWCYLAKSTTVIGVPFQPDITQVTYDGALFTKHAELSFFYGLDKKPVMARQKTYTDGFIPIVQYDWTEDFLRYNIEMFCFKLDGEDESNTINFVSVNIKNLSASMKKSHFSVALRNTGKDYRFQGLDFSDPVSGAPVIPMVFNENWIYDMQDNGAFRDGKLIYTFDNCFKKEIIKGVPYEKKFTGKDYAISETTSTCFACYEEDIAPGDGVSYIFKMPRVPVSIPNLINKIFEADYDSYKQKTINYWKSIFENGATYSIPEKRVQDAMYASFVHLLLSTRTKNEQKIQTDGLPYPNFFLTSLPQMGFAYLSMNHPEFLKHSILNGISQQEENGLYFDKSLAHGDTIPAAHGHIMYITAMYCIMCNDLEMANIVYPSIKKAVEYIKESIAINEYGLLPPTYPYDNEMIDGHYTSNNMWSLLGLRCAIRLSRMLEKKQEEKEWSKLEQVYSNNVMKAIETSAHSDGYVPTGFYKYLKGTQARRGFKDYQTDCDWENMLLSYPTEILSTDDFKLKGTLNRVRKNYAEGIMTYRHGMHLHQYITANLIEQYMVMGDSYTALKDFYHLLLHSGSTHEGFENLVKPWADRQVDPECPSPHGWAAAKIVFLIRNLLIHEYGGEAGMNPNERDLHLFSVISPEWAKPGNVISFRNVLTEMGAVSASMEVDDISANIIIESNFTSKPRYYKIRIPYFKDLSYIEADSGVAKVENGWVIVSNDATKIKLFWKDKQNAHMATFEEILTEYRSSNSFEGIDENYCPIIKTNKPFILEEEKRSTPEPLCFKLVQDAFTHEYKRRFIDFVHSGGEIIHVDAPDEEISNKYYNIREGLSH